MRRLIVGASVGSLLAIKLIPVQRPNRHLNKQSDAVETSSASVGSNQVVLDQIQSVKKVLVQSEVMRNELNELVAEFSSAETRRRKVGVYKRAQTLVLSFLDKFDKTDVTKTCTSKDDCNTGHSTYSMELREHIRLAFEKEGNHYLEFMDGVIQHGWTFVHDKGSIDNTIKTEPTLSTSAASFKTRDDVKAVFLFWKERLEKTKKVEQVKKISQNYEFYSILGIIFAITAAACIGYHFYINRYGLPATKSNYRRKQMQRRQFMTNTIHHLSKWSKVAFKISVELLSFLMFSVILGFTCLQAFFGQMKSKMIATCKSVNTSTHSLASSKKISTRPVIKRKKHIIHQDSELSSECSPVQKSDPVVVIPPEEVCPVVVDTSATEKVIEVSILSHAEEPVELSEGDTITVDHVDCADEVQGNAHLNVTEMMFVERGRDDSCGRDESPSSVARLLSSEDNLTKSPEDVSVHEDDLPLQSKAFASVKLSAATEYSSDDEGWTLQDSAQAARIRTLRKKAPPALNANGRGRSKEGRNRKPAAPTLSQRSSRPTQPKMLTTTPSNESCIQAVNISHTRQQLSSADSTDHESVEESRESSTPVPIEKDEGTARNSPRSDNSDNGVKMNLEIAQIQTEFMIPSAPESMYVSPGCLPGQYYMVPQMMPQGVAWPPMAPQPFYPSMPPAAPYCYGPPSPYGVPVQYPVMDGYIVDGMSLSPVSPAGVPMPSQTFPVMSPVVDDRLTEAIRLQVEYYFSVENLCRDVYLRNKMDGQGFVLLEEILQFNRIRHLNAPLIAVLRAVESSSKLEVLQPWAAKVSGSQVSDRAILDTKIRSAVGWERWILTANNVGNKVEVQP